MDISDKKILKLLIENCRYSLTDIAKSIKLSKDSVKNRIQKLEEEKIITNYSVMVDPRVLGYNINHLLLKLAPLKKEKESIISQLKNNKYITFISSQCGTYDMQIIYHAKNNYEKNYVKNEILNIFNNKLKSFEEVNHIEDFIFSFLFSDVNVDVKVNDKNNSSFSNSLNKIKYEANISKYSEFDSTDLQILIELIKNPRVKLINLANIVKMSPEGVKKRIKSIIERKGISNFTLFPNYEKLDLFNYMLLFKCKPFDKDTL